MALQGAAPSDLSSSFFTVLAAVLSSTITSCEPSKAGPGVISSTWLGGMLYAWGSSTMTGSLAFVAGWTSTPSLDSSSDRPRDLENFMESLSCPLSIGDHPPTLPAMIPAITAVAPRAELDLERFGRPRFRVSGLGMATLFPEELFWREISVGV
jgi:hypothetical protein